VELEGIEGPSGWHHRYHSPAASRADDDDQETIVVEIADEFTSLDVAARYRLTEEWLSSLRTEDPIELRFTGADMVAEARAETGL
jgi:hypothetical protein